MKLRNIILYIFLPFFGFNQINEDLTPEERAYMFHVVKKSPILNNELGRYFDYKGPEIRFHNKDLNYDSIELLIINRPELLIIRKSEIAKSAKGILSEAANKMALWELNKVLLAKRGTEKEFEPYEQKYLVFENFVKVNIPDNALKQKDGKYNLHPKLLQLTNPSLSFDDKIALIETLNFLSTQEAFKTIQCLNEAVNQYVEKRTFEIYRALGGQADEFVNVLVAAGDGSSTSGILEEREKDEKGRWNKGLPKAVGLFPYQMKLEYGTNKKDTKIKPLMFTETDLQTVGNNRITNLHFDVWGYNAKKQTTVVIEKNGLSYHLFGAGDTRFLSPDSSFSQGGTFQSIIADLENNKIGDLKEMIYGKRGFDYWITYNKKKKDETELKIEINEKKYSDLTMKPIYTKRSASGSVKKSKRKSKGGPADFQPTTKSQKKQKKESQNEIVYLYGLYEAYKKKIVELEKQKQEAIDLMAKYQQKLDLFKRMMGHKWANFTVENGLYSFEDSTTFDIQTQEFQFPASAQKEDFEVRLIAIPESCLSKNADEVMLHINLVDAKPNYNAKIQVALNDVFESDKWELKNNLFTHKDSVALRQFFEGLLNKKVAFSIHPKGQGIGIYDGNRVVKNTNIQELNNYPGNTPDERLNSRRDSSFQRLRLTELMIHMDRTIRIDINSFTDPVKSNLTITNKTLLAMQDRYKLSKNDILSVYRTYTVLQKLKEEINFLAGTYLNREEAKIVIDRFNKEWVKSKISVGTTSIKITEL